MEDAILIAGGYGVVGQQLAEMIRLRHSDLPLILAGRNPVQAEPLAQRLARANTLRLDMEQTAPLHGARPRAVVAVANDPHDYLLLEAVRAGLPYLDITRWTERLRRALSRVAAEAVRAPVLLSSAWMAGAVAVVAVAAARRLAKVQSIDLSVLYALKDKAGPNSADYMDRLATPFEVTLNGERRLVYPFTDPRQVAFPGGTTAKVHRFDTPDQFTLPLTTGAETVAARIAFDEPFTTQLLAGLIRSGVWRLISGPRFTPLRRALLYNPGQGAPHAVVVEVAGWDAQGRAQTARATLVDPQGQTHLTALGALVQLERLLGLDGAPPPSPAIVYPDSAPQVDAALQTFRALGAQVTLS
jgi:hypothetical protein